MDSPEPARHRWRTARTISGLTFVVGAALALALTCVTDSDLLIGPPFAIAYLALIAFVASIFDYRTVTLRARIQALAGILAACGIMLLVLLRVMEDPGAARLLSGLPAGVAVFMFADAWCKEVGWTRDSPRRYWLLLVPTWILTVLHSFFAMSTPQSLRWPIAMWGLGVLFWPSKKLPSPPPRYGFRSAMIGTYREVADSLGQMIAVPPRDTWQLWLSDLVLGTGTPWLTPTIDRTFPPDAAIRLHAVVASRSPAVGATIAIADEPGRVVYQTTIEVEMRALEILPPPNDPLTGRPAPPPVRRAPAPASQPLWGGAIHIPLPLAALAPGHYRVTVTATDAGHEASGSVAIVVAGPGSHDGADRVGSAVRAVK